MRTEYGLLGTTCAKDVTSNGFIITNKKGAYFSQQYPRNISHFDGFFTLEHENAQKTEWTMYKIIDRIQLDEEPQTLSISEGKAAPQGAEFTISSAHSLIIRSDKRYHIDFDCRHVYDFSNDGRMFDIVEESIKGHPAMLIRYRKYADATLNDMIYEKYVCVMGYASAQAEGIWVPRSYAYDGYRKGHEHTRYVYRGLHVTGNAVIHCAPSASEAMQACFDDFIHFDYHFDISHKTAKEFLNHMTSLRHVEADDETTCALLASMLSLRSLVTKTEQHRGIWAGLPWFFHFWSRDELISLGGILASEEMHFAIDLIRKYLSEIGSDGLIPNRLPRTQLSSADSIGLFCMRLHQIVQTLQVQDHVKTYFSEKSLEDLKHQLSQSVHAYEAHHTHNDIVMNKSKETWMDTDIDGEGFRAGMRIELQALHLRMHILLKDLCLLTLDKNYAYHEKRIQRIQQAVQERFVHDGRALDGLWPDWSQDHTARSNVFLAYYCCPELFSRDVWIKTFDHALQHIWLDWGGLSSIDTHDPLFCPEYTGESDRSYHRGDSWYFINNIAAIAMHRLDKRRYERQIREIQEASVHETLWQGKAGAGAEISSAKARLSQGCMLQAWSCATLIELILLTKTRK